MDDVIKDRRAIATQRAALIGDKNFPALLALDRDQLKAFPDDAERHRLLSWTLATLDQVEEAIQHQLVAVEAAPDNPRLRKRLANLYARNGDHEAAKAQAAEARRAAKVEEQQFAEAQITHKRSSLSKLQSGLGDLGSWRYGASGGELKFAPLFDRHAIDTMANWARYIPTIAAPGELVEVDGIGKFRVGDAAQTLHWRLARGIPWELPNAVLVSEIAARSDPATLLVEVGANIGTLLIPMARNFGGEVLAFEPLEENYANLVEHIELNGLKNVTALKMAAGSASGKGSMVHANPRNPGLARLDVESGGGIEITTVDAEAARMQRPVAFIKLDVEGHEAAVLEGAMKTLTTDRPLVLMEMLPEKSGRLREIMAGLDYVGRQVFRADWLFHPA